MRVTPVRSSTSSSDARRIGGAIATFVVVTIAYGWCAERWFPGGVPSAYQRRANTITAEKLLHGGEHPALVVVGSSMGAVLPSAELPPGSYNLSMSSFGAQTGLAILARAQERPRIVLVEANVTALKPPSHELLESLFEPATFALQRWVPVARHDRQPIALLDEALRRLTARGKVASDYVMPQALYRQHLAELQAAQSQWASTAATSSAIDALAVEVRALEAGGAEVVFFETPEDASLHDAAETAGVRALLRARFANHRWLATDAWGEYQTTDGLHLIPQSAERFARFLRAGLAHASP
jgi:hypothetical protein